MRDLKEFPRRNSGPPRQWLLSAGDRAEGLNPVEALWASPGAPQQPPENWSRARGQKGLPRHKDRLRMETNVNSPQWRALTAQKVGSWAEKYKDIQGPVSPGPRSSRRGCLDSTPMIFESNYRCKEVPDSILLKVRLIQPSPPTSRLGEGPCLSWRIEGLTPDSTTFFHTTSAVYLFFKESRFKRIWVTSTYVKF